MCRDCMWMVMIEIATLYKSKYLKSSSYFYMKDILYTIARLEYVDLGMLI